MRIWVARAIVVLLIPVGMLVLIGWLLEDWLRSRKIGGAP